MTEPEEELWSDAEFGEWLRNIRKETVMLDLEANMTDDEKRIMRHLREKHIEELKLREAQRPRKKTVKSTDQREET